MTCRKVNSTRVSVRARRPVLSGSLKDQVPKPTRLEQELHDLSCRLMRVRDDERRALARELHESTGQTLAALKMTLGNLRDSFPRKRGRASSLIESCCELTEWAIREIRTVSYLMYPPMLDEAGLPSAVRWFARGFSERSNIAVTVDIPEHFDRLPQEVELTIFRLIQESLTNVYRYSGSATARICLTPEEDFIRVEVSDAGRGICSDQRSGYAIGVGITGMREQVRCLNGVFEIESAPGRGTTVRALFPDSHASGPVSNSRRLEPGQAAPRETICAVHSNSEAQDDHRCQSRTGEFTCDVSQAVSRPDRRRSLYCAVRAPQSANRSARH